MLYRVSSPNVSIIATKGDHQEPAYAGPSVFLVWVMLWWENLGWKESLTVIFELCLFACVNRVLLCLLWPRFPCCPLGIRFYLDLWLVMSCLQILFVVSQGLVLPSPLTVLRRCNSSAFGEAAPDVPQPSVPDSWLSTWITLPDTSLWSCALSQNQFSSQEPSVISAEHCRNRCSVSLEDSCSWSSFDSGGWGAKCKTTLSSFFSSFF